MYEFIPEELKRLKNWVCWKAEPDPKAHSGLKKIPINPHTGGQAMSNNPDTWSDFETAVRVSADLAGIGFVFDGSGYFGVDLDDMPDALEQFKGGMYDNVIGEFVYGLKSYTELSYSGSGIHIICKGRLPEGARRRSGIEMYEKSRFFVMTGNYCSEFVDISDCTEAVKPLHEKYLIHIIPFTVSIPVEKVDRRLKYKLREELPDILAWAVEGCRIWQSEGLRMPKAVLSAVQEYRHEMDVISAFADACCAVGGEAKASQLYAVYAEWAGENNEYRICKKGCSGKKSGSTQP